MSERHRNPFLIDDEPQAGSRRVTLIVVLAIALFAAGVAVFLMTAQGTSSERTLQIEVPQPSENVSPE